MKFCKAVLCHLAGLAARVLVALAAVLALSVLVLVRGRLRRVPVATEAVLGRDSYPRRYAGPRVGCSKPNPEPPKPATIHWRGPGTGYEDTTTAKRTRSPQVTENTLRTILFLAVLSVLSVQVAALLLRHVRGCHRWRPRSLSPRGQP